MSDVLMKVEAQSKLKLRNMEGEIVEVEKDIALHMNFVKHMLEDVDEYVGMVVPVESVCSYTLSKVLEYCKFKHESEVKKMYKDEIESWEQSFVQVDKELLVALINAANFLNIPSLLKLSVGAFAEMLKGKTAEQIRAEFDIENDFKTELSEELRRENFWITRFA